MLSGCKLLNLLTTIDPSDGFKYEAEISGLFELAFQHLQGAFESKDTTYSRSPAVMSSSVLAVIRILEDGEDSDESLPPAAINTTLNNKGGSGVDVGVGVGVDVAVGVGVGVFVVGVGVDVAVGVGVGVGVAVGPDVGVGVGVGVGPGVGVGDI